MILKNSISGPLVNSKCSSFSLFLLFYYSLTIYPPFNIVVTFDICGMHTYMSIIHSGDCKPKKTSFVNKVGEKENPKTRRNPSRILLKIHAKLKNNNTNLLPSMAMILGRVPVQTFLCKFWAHMHIKRTHSQTQQLPVSKHPLLTSTRYYLATGSYSRSVYYFCRSASPRQL